MERNAAQVSKRSGARKLVFVLGLTVCANLLRYSLEGVLQEIGRFIFFHPVVVLSAWYGGLRFGGIAILVCLFSVEFFWSESPFSFAVANAEDFVGLLSFAAVGAFLAIFTDATRQALTREQEAQRTVARQKREFETILSSISDGFTALDRDWCFVFVNDRACSMFRREREELVGRRLWEIFPRISGRKAQEELERAMSERLPVFFEAYYEPFDLWYEARVYPVTDGGIVMYQTDITGRKRIELELEKARASLRKHADSLEVLVAQRTRKLEETIRELEAFSYTVSHDLRTPLRAMHGFATMVLMNPQSSFDSESEDYLKRIAAAAARMDKLIQDVLVVSHIGKEEVELKPVELRPFLEQLVLSMPNLKAARAEIKIHGHLHTVRAHPSLLSQALTNLLVNAVKFIAPGEQPGIEIWTERKGARVQLFLKDNGIGIEPSYLNKIFEVFQTANRGQYEGTGAGLAIVNKAVQKLGGTVGVRSEPNKGSLFWIELESAPEPA